MAKQLIFSDVVMESFGRTMKGCTARMTAPVPAKLAAQMGWDELPPVYTGGNVDTDLHATQVSLKPKNEEVAKFGFDLKARRLYNVVLVKKELEGKRGKGKHTVANFTVEFNEERACASLEKYMVNCGAIKGKMHLNYEPAAEQGSLVDVTNSADQNQSSLTLV